MILFGTIFWRWRYTRTKLKIKNVFQQTKNLEPDHAMSSFIGSIFKVQQEAKNVIGSHPVGLNGQNFIVIPTPIKYLPKVEFEKRQKSMNSSSSPALMKSMSAIKSKVIESKNQAKQLKEKGNIAFYKKRYNDAEKCYSEAIQLNTGLRLLWTNRAACRYTMKKHNEALSDCDTALVLNPKCTRTIIQKGNALLALGRFDEAKDFYESLRALGEASSADHHLRKLENIQERFQSLKISYFFIILILFRIRHSRYSVDG